MTDFGIGNFLFSRLKKYLEKKEKSKKATEILNRLKFELIAHKSDYKKPKLDGFVKNQESEWTKNENLFLSTLKADDFSMINRYFTTSFYPAKALLNSKSTMHFSNKERELLDIYADDAELTILVISKAQQLPELHKNIDVFIQEEFVSISQRRNKVMNCDFHHE